MDKEKMREDMKGAIKDSLSIFRAILLDHGINSLPREVTELPSYANDFLEYVRQKAREDLPESQFTGKIYLNNVSDMVEIGGYVGYNGEFIEISYAKPDTNNVNIKKNRDRTSLQSSTKGESNLDFQKLEESDDVISWHTHPVPEAPSYPDFDHMIKNTKMLQDLFENKKAYFVLYLPLLDQANWFEVKENCRHT
ncbi:MAG: hypothetical protein JSV92_05075 [archaeon]|nr:MAG: hypothetical protein JSV92_05075 [archaeon]